MSFTFPPRKILAAFDGSGPGLAALRAAVDLAKTSGADLQVVFASSPPVTVPYSYDAFDANAAYALQKECERLKKDWHETARAQTRGLPKRRVSLKWISGWPAETILGTARTSGADLLVAGTHGRSGLGRLFLGSVAEQLVRRSPVPVLCVHEGTSLKGGILAPYNLRTYAEPALLFALDLGAASGRPVTALYVAEEGEKAPQAQLELAVRLETRLGQRAARGVEYKVRRGDPRVEIAKEAARGRYGLVVLSSHVKPTLADRALGSTAERLLRKARVAVLAMPAETAAPRGRRAAVRTRRDTGGTHGSLRRPAAHRAVR
jgi:nucleotide-binding universal stress UspA family protein